MRENESTSKSGESFFSEFLNIIRTISTKPTYVEHKLSSKKGDYEADYVSCNIFKAYNVCGTLTKADMERTIFFEFNQTEESADEFKKVSHIFEHDKLAELGKNMVGLLIKKWGEFNKEYENTLMETNSSDFSSYHKLRIISQIFACAKVLKIVKGDAEEKLFMAFLKKRENDNIFIEDEGDYVLDIILNLSLWHNKEVKSVRQVLDFLHTQIAYDNTHEKRAWKQLLCSYYGISLGRTDNISYLRIEHNNPNLSSAIFKAGHKRYASNYNQCLTSKGVKTQYKVKRGDRRISRRGISITLDKFYDYEKINEMLKL